MCTFLQIFYTKLWSVKVKWDTENTEREGDQNWVSRSFEKFFRLKKTYVIVEELSHVQSFAPYFTNVTVAFVPLKRVKKFRVLKRILPLIVQYSLNTKNYSISIKDPNCRVNYFYWFEVLLCHNVPSKLTIVVAFVTF